MSLFNQISEKLNPAQRYIAEEAGRGVGSNQTKLRTIENAYDQLEIVNRCINLIVDLGSEVDFDVKEKLPFTPSVTGPASGRFTGFRNKQLNSLLNLRPSPDMDKSTFRRLLLIDMLIDGNCFIHFDGANLYHVPAKDMEIETDAKEMVSGYTYNSTVKFAADEIIHIRDNSANSFYRNYRGRSRVNAALNSILTHEAALDFQYKFYDSGTIIGLIIETEQVLNNKIKDRKEREWGQKFNAKSSNQGKPMILDAGMKAKSLQANSFRDMDFNGSLESIEKRIALAMGVPYILLDSGNNANIRPNLELLFSTTIIPMMRKIESALETAFAYDIEVTTHKIIALRPDMKAESDRLSSLVNNGIMIGNEARAALRLEPIDTPEMNEIRIPANIAGSATGVSGQEGGKPKQDKE